MVFFEYDWVWVRPGCAPPVGEAPALLTNSGALVGSVVL